MTHFWEPGVAAAAGFRESATENSANFNVNLTLGSVGRLETVVVSLLQPC